MSASLSFSPLKKTLVVASRGRRHHHRMLSSICVRRPRANAVGGDDGRESRPRRRGRSSEGGRGGDRGRRSTKSSEEDYKITLRNIRKSSKRFDTDEQVSEMYGRSAELKKAMESGMPSVKLARGKANIFMDGNPLVYGGAIDSTENNPENGQAVGVFDHNFRPVGWGAYNSSSMFRVRMLELAKETESPILIKRVVKKRIQEAQMLREKVLDTKKGGKTNAYRLINSEGDRLSGMIIDKYGNDNHFVVSSSAGWVEMHKRDIIDALREVMMSEGDGKNDEDMTIVWRRDTGMYDLEGVDVTEKVSVYDKNGDDASASLQGEIEIMENGVKYLVNLVDGHKTGFYVDQRDNRSFVGELSKINNGKSDFSVLDCCTYTGGFAINAAVAGCKNVTAVDSSKIVLSIAARNAELNNVHDSINFVPSDVFDYLDDCISNNRQYDVLVVDPPKFAPTVKSLSKALLKYIGLNARAMRCVKPGGILISCSCSGAVTQRKLLPNIVFEASQAANRRIVKVKDGGAGVDQPIDPTFPEGEYLSVVAVRVM